VSFSEPSTGGWNDGYFVGRDGLRLHYRDYAGSADQPPLLCLPGLTRNSRDFAVLAERYSPRFRVLALDFRGRGLSDRDPVPARYIPPAYAADAVELLDHLRLERAIFVGTSLGGLVTMAVALIAPQRIAGAILNDVGPELGQVGLDRIQAYVGKSERFGSWDEAARAIATSQAQVFPGYGHEDWLATARRNCREQDGRIVFDYDMAIGDVFEAAGPRPKIDMWPLFLALAQKPLLVVRGQLSELLSVETLEKMRKAAPDTEFAQISNVGHAPMLDEPEAFAAIDRFLTRFEH
jgi:pimeloyl-ACP methyl ester carboxylesterase